MKKIFVSTGIALLLLILLASIAFATRTMAGKKELPFKGTFQAVETYVTNFPIMSVTASGSGNATHLGQYTINYEVEVDLKNISGVESAHIVAVNGNSLSFPIPLITRNCVESAHIVAANGDSLFAEGLGQVTSTEAVDVSNIVENYTITGGTGRFAGASGSFTLNRVVNTTTGVTSGTFDGNIVLP